MIRKQIVATDQTDRQNHRISERMLRQMALNFTESDHATKMGVAHDSTLLPVGKVLNGTIVPLEDGITGLEVQIDDFIDKFTKIIGPDDEQLYFGESIHDSRPFVECCSGIDGDLIVGLNPVDFSMDDFEEVVQFITDVEKGQVETLTKKALEPEIEVVFTLATKVLLYLTLKRSFDKSADKISDDIVECYDQIKRLGSYILSRIKGKRTIAYLLSAPDQPIELIVRCDNAETLTKAIEEKDSGYIAETYEKYTQYLNGGIKKIQFIFNVEAEKWELNYLTSYTGQVIGTEKCYRRTVRIYNDTMQSPTAAFSIGAPVTYKVEEIPDA